MLLSKTGGGGSDTKQERRTPKKEASWHRREILLQLA